MNVSNVNALKWIDRNARNDRVVNGYIFLEARLLQVNA